MPRADTPPAFRTPDRFSALDPYKPYLTKRFDEHGLSAVRLRAEIAAQLYTGSVHTVRRFLATLRPLRQAAAKATLRFEAAPDEQAQVDWAHCGRHIDASGREIRVYAFVMVLSFSRMTFVCFTRSMGVEDLVECHRLAFERFGGVPAPAQPEHPHPLLPSGEAAVFIVKSQEASDGRGGPGLAGADH